MSTGTTLASESASEDWQLVDADAPKPASLVVQLRRATFVLPYFRFLYAEGNDALAKITFASHSITIAGHGLAALLAAVAANRLVRIVQPTGNEAKFGVRGVPAAQYAGPSITDVSVDELQ